MNSFEQNLINVLNAGFDKASSSFAKLIGQPVSLVPSKSTMFHPFENRAALSGKKGELYILITSIIGDVKGKSFLIFSKEEVAEIFKTLNSTSNQELKDAFLLEIDNIISAAVIAELSTAFNLEIFGDVPQLIRINAAELLGFFVNEAKKDPTASVVISTTSFQFNGKQVIHPQFAWILSKNIIEKVPVEKPA